MIWFQTILIEFVRSSLMFSDRMFKYQVDGNVDMNFVKIVVGK